MSTLAKPIFRAPPHAPPKDFDPSKASDLDLEKYFYPPRPDPVKAPLEYATWESFSVQRLEWVEPDLTERPSTGLSDSKYWAGTYLHASKEPEKATDEKLFFRVVGTWNVPEFSPIEIGEGDDKKLEDGSYEAATWVGIDGWDNKVNLRAGVLSDFQIAGGEYAAPAHLAVIEFHQEEPLRSSSYAFPKFFVHTRDQITVHVWGKPNTSVFYGAIWNITRGLYSSVRVEPGFYKTLKGHTALWVLAGNDNVQFPRFHQPIYYWNLVAHLNDAANTEVSSEKGEIFLTKHLPIEVEVFKAAQPGLIFRDTYTQS